MRIGAMQKTKRKIGALYFVVAAMFFSDPAIAKEQCHITTYAKNIAHNLQEIMQSYNDLIARICYDGAERVTRYDSIGPAWTTRQGVCQFYLAQRMPAYPGRVRVSYFMLRSKSGICPRQDIEQYVAVSGVSPGVFLQLDQFWERLGESDQNFGNAFQLLPSEKRAGNLFKEIKRSFQTKEGLPRLATVELVPDTLGVSSTGYKLMQKPRDGRAFALFVDITRDGFKVFDIGLLVQ